jgi:Tol biopolymer transport system component
VSVSSGGAQGNQESDTAPPSISADGRYVAFASAASNLVANDTNLWGDIFVRDRQLGVTERVSLATGGAEANGFCSRPSISADGRYVAFHRPPRTRRRRHQRKGRHLCATARPAPRSA